MGLLNEWKLLLKISSQNEMFSRHHLKNLLILKMLDLTYGNKFLISSTQQFAFRKCCLPLSLILKIDNWIFGYKWFKNPHSRCHAEDRASAAAEQWSIPGEWGFLSSPARILASVVDIKPFPVQCIRSTAVETLVLYWHRLMLTKYVFCADFPELFFSRICLYRSFFFLIKVYSVQDVMGTKRNKTRFAV